MTLSVTPTSQCNNKPSCRYCYLKGKQDVAFPVFKKKMLAFFKKQHTVFDQFHFLIPKGVVINFDMGMELNKIRMLKMFFPDKVYVDECLKLLLTKEPCRRGKELLCLNSDATVTLCSFASLEDQEINISKCPYLNYG